MSTRGESSDEWVTPLPGHWRRDFRLAEWLPGPVTLSCETWLLPALDRGFSETSLDEYGSGTKPGVVVVNGWCYSTDPMPTNLLGMLRAPLRMVRIGSAMARMAKRPELVERWVAIPGARRYADKDLPALRATIADAQQRIDAAPATELVAIIDGLAVATGRLMLGMVQTMGYAAKVEYALATFFSGYLAGRVECSPLDLTVGFTTPTPSSAHAVVTLDWSEPTAGERGDGAAPDDSVRNRLIATREGAEAACRAAIAGDDRALERFDRLVGMLAHWIPVRESMAAEFTLAWPAMRAAFARLGAALVTRGVLASRDDVYELSRDEVLAAADGDSTARLDVVEERRTERQRRSKLSPPLSIGKPVRQWKQIDAITALLRSEPPTGARVIVRGIGSSPGTVTAVARVVLTLDDFDLFQPGEILVAPATAPGWTPLFAIAAGVVTDAGGPFAHTSIVAREFGIPAIVTATGATELISTGSIVTLDAASGTVSEATIGAAASLGV